MRIRIVRIPLYVVAGVALTYLTAWAVLWTAQLRSVRGPVPGAWAAGNPYGWPEPPQSKRAAATGARWAGDSLRAENDNGTIRMMADPESSFTQVVTLDSSLLEVGWPMLALRTRAWNLFNSPGAPAVPTPAALTAWEAGWEVPLKSLPPSSIGERRLPLHPLWAGFAANAAFYTLVAAAASHIPMWVRWALRRRCGLCTGCGYPIAAIPVCSECGRAVRPRSAAPPPPRAIRWPWLGRHLWFVGAALVLLATAVYLASGQWGFYLKAPGGWYAAVWRGQLALCRADAPFQEVGVEVRRFATPYRLGSGWQNELVGRRLGIPLLLAILLASGVLAAAWWRGAVRRGLSRHWPPGGPAAG